MTVVTELFQSDNVLPVGIAVSIGGTAEIVACSNGGKVVGVVSGSDQSTVTVIVKGRAQIRCMAPIKKGDRLVASDNGIARATQPGHPDVFAIALEDNRGTIWGRDLVSGWIL
ncbi:MAG: hypothetical protein ACOYNN_14510 [Terrimicrobiaceae bacterium]